MEIPRTSIYNLKRHGIRQSIYGKARWVDNVMIERWLRSLKTENIYITEYATPRDLRAGISAYITEYNHDRPHETFDYATPASVYGQAFDCVANL